LGTWYLVPILLDAGMPMIAAFPLTMWVPIYALLPIPFLLYRREGGEWSWPAFRDRFRLRRPSRRDWLWGLGGVVAVIVSEELLKPLSVMLARIESIAPPAHYPPLFDPTNEIEFPITEFLGVGLPGNWLFLILLVPLHTVAMIAEELLWRGYILPRQEVSYGRWAWLVNGLLWAYLVHMLLPWAFLGFLPSMLLTPYLAQRCRSTWVSLMVHGIANSLMWFIFLYCILQ